MAIHMAESPIGFMAALHAGAAVQNLLAVEYHSSDVVWWNDLAFGIDNPIIKGRLRDRAKQAGSGHRFA